MIFGTGHNLPTISSNSESLSEQKNKMRDLTSDQSDKGLLTPMHYCNVMTELL
jgi:hypothetical protein